MFWDLQSAAKILNFKVLSTEVIFNINTAYSVTGFWIVKKKVGHSFWKEILLLNF